MASSRFFVTNLPADTTEDELRELFKKCGPITLVELKTKENILEPGNVNVFAFVTLQISADDAQYYLNELKWKKLRGAKLKISLAKESFLERLKRERAENEINGDRAANSQAIVKRTDEIYNNYVPENLQNTRRIFNEDEDFNDDEIDPDLLITKKRAGRSIQNGKIVIEESGAAPLHIIEKPKKLKSSMVTTAEQKRKESLHKMKNQYDQKKNLIQSALSGINGSSSKRIKFSDDEGDEEVTNQKNKSELQIFGSDDEAGDEDISSLNIQYGKKGEKLAKLQSEHQSLDSRFKLDAKFVDDNNDNDENYSEHEIKQNEDDERKWQLNILEQVVGYKLDTDTQAQKAAKSKKMTRFDPSKAEHEKFLRHATTENILKKESKKKEKVSSETAIEEVSKTETEAPAVSKEVFYVVSNTLTDALKSRGEGFSLLNMFGQQAAELEEREVQLNQLKDERILVNKLNKNAAAVLNYESSSSGGDIDEESSNKKSKNDSRTTKTPTAKNTKSGKTSQVILAETFFISKGDARLKEGANFFHYDKLNQIPEEDYEPVRKRLNKLIKKKIIKAKKNMVNAGRKVRRNKRRV